MKRTILVTGATGAQGGAVADALLRRGHRVRALTRSPASLAGRGMDVRRGDFDDFASLLAAATGVDAVFVMSTPFGSDVRTEVRHAKAMIDAAVDAGVDHLVYTSAANADRGTGIPHFDSKYEVERYLIDRWARHTILAPAAFVDDKLGSWALESLRHGSYPLPLSSDRPLAMISAADIGAVAALVFEAPAPSTGTASTWRPRSSRRTRWPPHWPRRSGNRCGTSGCRSSRRAGTTRTWPRCSTTSKRSG